MKRILTILILTSSITFGQSLFSSRTYKNYKYICKQDTLIVIDTLTKKTVIKNIQYFRYILSINEHGILKARVSDAFMLLNHKGEILNGPFSIYQELEGGFIYTSYQFTWPGNRDRKNIVFNAKGDTVLVTFDFPIYSLSDTLVFPAYNPKTKRKEMGVLTKKGWLTKEYQDKNGNWTKTSTK